MDTVATAIAVTTPRITSSKLVFSGFTVIYTIINIADNSVITYVILSAFILRQLIILQEILPLS